MMKLLIFDLDGTLVDTIEDITEAVNYTVQSLGVRRHTADEIKLMVGGGLSKLIERLIPDHSDQGEHVRGRDEAVKRFIGYYSKHLLDKSQAYPGVKETLARLQDYRKAVVSNKRETLSREVLDGLGIAGFFDIILGSDSVSEKKPSPVPLLEVLKRMGMTKEEAVIIGDSSFDIEAGKRAGILTIAVTYGYRDRDILKDADYMIDSFRELPGVLKKIENSR
jgi:phosphoglycolate phosphatase